jgi:hypothetical protein
MKFLLTLAVIIVFPLSTEAAGFNRTSVTKPTTLRKEQRDTFTNPIGESARREQEKNKKAAEEKRKDVTFTHRATGISVTYPYDWKTSNFAKNKGFAAYHGLMSMSVVVEPALNKKDMTLEEVEKWFLNKATLADSNRLIDWYIPSFHILSTDDTTLFGKPAKKFSYTGETNSVKMSHILYITSFDQKIYRVRFTEFPEHIESARQTLEALLASLTIKPVKTEVAPKGKTRR